MLSHDMSLNVMRSIVNVFLGQLAVKLIPVKLYENNSTSYFGKCKKYKGLGLQRQSLLKQYVTDVLF